jgi:hypothetical protein
MVDHAPLDQTLLVWHDALVQLICFVGLIGVAAF